MDEPRRLVVYNGDPSHSVAKAIFQIDDAQPGLQWLMLHHAPQKSLSQLLRSQQLNLKRNGWRWIPYQALEIARLVWQRTQERQAPGSERVHDFSVRALQKRANFQVEHVQDIHAPEVLQRVRDYRPDLGLSLAAPILRRSLFSIPRLGTINLHKGKLPDFRGMPPAFWELMNDQPSVGCSVHYVDDKLDTGAVLQRATVPRAMHATLRGLQLELDEVGNRILGATVRQVLSGISVAEAQTPGSGKTFRKPTLEQQGALRRKLSTPLPWSKRVTHTVKEIAFSSASAVHSLLLRHFIAPRVTVLLYHRVTDEVRDNLTVGVAQFERQMAYVARHCQVLSIEEVIAMPTPPRGSRPLVAETFDDGYLDNHAHAVPILLRHRVPAAFFVSTGIVGTDGRFPHDLRRGNPPIPVMRWDQLREMQKFGFTVGSHSVSHIDCAAEPEAMVRDELIRSRAAIEAELHLRDVIFAYPYGGRQHMTPARLEMVRQAGYVGCLSAYGGTNVGRVDAFNVLRKGINHDFSDRAFRWECLGMR